MSLSHLVKNHKLSSNAASIREGLIGLEKDDANTLNNMIVLGDEAETILDKGFKDALHNAQESGDTIKETLKDIAKPLKTKAKTSKEYKEAFNQAKATFNYIVYLSVTPKIEAAKAAKAEKLGKDNSKYTYEEFYKTLNANELKAIKGFSNVELYKNSKQLFSDQFKGEDKAKRLTCHADVDQGVVIAPPKVVATTISPAEKRLRELLKLANEKQNDEFRKQQIAKCHKFFVEIQKIHDDKNIAAEAKVAAMVEQHQGLEAMIKDACAAIQSATIKQVNSIAQCLPN